MIEFLKAVIAIGVGWILGAWSMMVSVGIIHADWWPMVPLMSFHAALAIFSIVIVVAVAVGVCQAIFGLDK